MTETQQQAINELRDAGYCVVIWTPEEIGDADIGTLEDITIERGSLYTESFNSDD